MSTLTASQELPQNLELNDWLKYSLASYNEISRQIALEEMITNGFASEFSPILTNMSVNDPSANCRAQASWLLKLTEEKSSLKSLIKKLDITPDFIKLQIQKNEYTKISLISQILRKSPQEQTIELWRQTLKDTTEPHLIQVGLDILSKFGNKNDTEYALKYLENKNSQIICSALSLLVQQDKELFKKHIKLGLSSKIAEVLLHSVHLLKTVDETEAIKYLSVLILNKNPLVRQKAFRELMLVKFEKVEALFWQYLGREDQPFLLVKAGLLATFNPSQHFPFKIYDIMMSAAGAKKHILQLILKKTIKSTEISGVLKNKDINTYLNEIQHYINNKKTEQTIRITIDNLKSTDTSVRTDAVEKLSKYISNEKIKTLLENHLKIETDEGIKSHLSSILEEAPILPDLPDSNKISQETASGNNLEKTAGKLTSFPNTDDFIKLSVKEQRSLLKQINKIDDYPACKDTLLESINHDLKKSVLLDIIKIVGDYGKVEDGKKLYHLTKSSDNSIVAQTIKSIGSIDIDRILPELNKFLAHEDPRIKSAAFEIYIIADKPAAIQYVGTMLKNTKNSVRRIGLSLIPQLDYPSAEPLLWWMLEHETSIELQNQVGYMVAANPTKDGIFKVFNFTHDKNGEIKPGLSEIWEAALFSAEDVLGISKEEIEKQCWDEQVSSKTDEEKEKSDYKFNSIVGDKDEIDAQIESNNYNNCESILNAILLNLYNYKYYYIAATCILMVIIYFNTDKDTNKFYHGHKGKNTVSSNVNYIPNQGTDRKTQVGSEEWKEGIRSGAGRILNSPAYANLMQSAAKEQEEFREEAQKKEKEYYAKLANDPSADKEDREWAAAKLNDNYNEGMKAYNTGNFKDAEYLLEKAANDPSLNTFGKVDAIQKLVEICDSRQDKEAWMKWMGRLLKEAKNVEGFEHIAAFDDFEKTFSTMEDISKKIKDNPQAQEELVKGLKEKFCYTDDEAKQALNELLNFKHPFDNKTY